MIKTQFSKIKIKRSSITGVVPTLGATTDHTDGTWTGTDIYPGEFFINLADNKIWYGGISGIVEVKTNATYKSYVALLTQIGTNAPTSVVLENTIGTIAVNYVSPGNYTITSANLFTDDKTFVIINQSYTNAPTEHTFCYISGAGIIFVETTDETGTHINNVLFKTAIEIRVYN